eukprot:553449-Pelagomonas_calceolata.AAC.4
MGGQRTPVQALLTPLPATLFLTKRCARGSGDSGAAGAGAAAATGAIQQSLSKLAAGLLHKDDGGLPPVVERVNSWCMAWGPRRVSCACWSRLSATGSATELGASCTPGTALAWLWSAPGSSSCCNRRQFTGDGLEASLQQLEEENEQ